MFEVTSDNRLRSLIVVGDRVLIRPKNPDEKTRSGLYLPATITEKEQVQSGYVIKVGPGFPIPAASEDEPWKETEEKVKYMPLQAKEGDLAIFLQRNAVELEYDDQKYVIVPQSSILLLERSEDLFE
ncbi:co-chaperonin GroES (HSP10) [Dyadobacter jejuensis]|uniref:Co-chaperonin GroES (HSP10) n=1 Tax=Dyadobacter jejuensis TaxID=1082580 RepID=A0A316AHH1_9BACT|nr:co-chaperone GroES family protein [Dyadobacter jejuensis]PWJ57185.1 co-chaperonin GroES (HSP10) [Dyadobacter jejuensis]